VRDVVPDCDIEYAPDGGPDSRSYRVDFSKIREALPDFEPQWTARRGAQEVYEALRDADLTPDEFEGPRYRRIDHIKQLVRSNILSQELRWQSERKN
jgi:hypothetical protein